MIEFDCAHHVSSYLDDSIVLPPDLLRGGDHHHEYTKMHKNFDSMKDSGELLQEAYVYLNGGDKYWEGDGSGNGY